MDRTAPSEQQTAHYGQPKQTTGVVNHQQLVDNVGQTTWDGR